MEYDERKVEPISTGQHLYEQVVEQSDLCDVTVKIGHWEKLFHWCVLVASPFFASMYKNNFLERQTGIIELRIGTPLMLEQVLFFLYGNKPTITIDNVSEMLELSEYLLIPNLKSACINWVKTANVTDGNCMKLLELSSVYEFELPNCQEHLRRNIPEMMQTDDMINLTKESLMGLLSDITLSYVSATDWFRFIIRWSHRSQERKNCFPELFGLIDLEDVDVDFFENVIKKEPLFARMKNTDEFISKFRITRQLNHRTLIIQDPYEKHMLKCLDLDQNRWYKVSMSNDDPELDRYQFEEIIAVKGSEFSDVYKLIERDGEHPMVLTHDLSNGHFKKSVIMNKENNSGMLKIDHIHLTGQSCLVISNERVAVNRTKYTPLSGYATETLSLTEWYRETIDTSTLYTGTLQEGETLLTPLLTIPKNSIETICANEFSHTIAMLSSDKKSLFLFYEDKNQVECIDVEMEYDYAWQVKLASTVNGFVVCNDMNAICISRLVGPVLPAKYKMRHIALEKKVEGREVFYAFCDNQWFRYLYRPYGEDGELSCISHRKLLANVDGINIDWNTLAQDQNFEPPLKLFIVSLPKNKLKCHLQCPHCEETRISYSSDSYYNDSSSQDYIYDLDDFIWSD